jgi:hypothetical protein
MGVRPQYVSFDSDTDEGLGDEGTQHNPIVVDESSDESDDIDPNCYIVCEGPVKDPENLFLIEEIMGVDYVFDPRVVFVKWFGYTDITEEPYDNFTDESNQDADNCSVHWRNWLTDYIAKAKRQWFA